MTTTSNEPDRWEEDCPRCAGTGREPGRKSACRACRGGASTKSWGTLASWQWAHDDDEEAAARV